MARQKTGFVPGGIQSRDLPSPIQPGELAVHAIGRVDTMAEILVQSTWLRAAKLASQASGYGKARFQDVTGDYAQINKIAAAHRAMFTLNLDGQNAANLPQILTRPRLRPLVIAPQARTDLVSRPVNYADQLLENAVSDRVFALLRSTIERQRPGQPLEKNLLIDTVIRMKHLLHIGYDEAASRFRARQRERGWQEFRPGSGRSPLAGVSDAEIDNFLDKAFGGGMKVHVAGPTHYGDLPEIVLEISQEITDRATPAVCMPSELEAQIAAIESAAG